MTAGPSAPAAQTEAFLAAAPVVPDLLRRPEVAASWDRPSALSGLSVAGVAGHLVLSTVGALDAVLDGATVQPPGPGGRRPAEPGGRVVDAARFLRRARVTAPEELDGETHRWIRETSERLGRHGPEGLAERFEQRLEAQRPRLLACGADEMVVVPVDTTMAFGEYMATRVVELLVHADDLAASVGAPDIEIPPAAAEVALGALLGAARARAGDLGVLRGLARAERAPADVLRAL